MKRLYLSALVISSVASGCVTTPTTDQMCQSGTPAVNCADCKRAAEEYRRGNYREVERDATDKKRCLEELYKQCKELLQGSAQRRASDGETCEPPFGLSQDAVANLDLEGLEKVDPNTLSTLQKLMLGGRQAKSSAGGSN